MILYNVLKNLFTEYLVNKKVNMNDSRKSESSLKLEELFSKHQRLICQSYRYNIAYLSQLD